ncbi:proton-coupled folate transporter [Hyalella azteca]|uniref:Proton-coupled folate transporter n=1 Tax=Hyalella azteca TaxID=294128 RepID=A0A8B7NB79_HYAAZ|nr:proton-coupled folate transporter [Hyalella azteca]
MTTHNDSQESLLNAENVLASSSEPLAGVGAVKKFVLSISVEPVLFSYVLAMSLTSTLTTSLLLERICLLTFGGNETICSNISQNSSLQNNVEKTTADINLYCNLITNLPSIILGPLLGDYSDKHGRKLPLVLPLVGATFTSIAQMAFAFVQSADPMWLVACSLPRGLTGGFAILIMACYSYITDKSGEKSRTSRIAVLDAAMVVALPVGLLLSDVLYSKLGYWPVFAVSACIYLLALQYLAVRINSENTNAVREPCQVVWDQHGDGDMEPLSPDNVQPAPENNALANQMLCIGGCMTSLRDTINTCCKRRPCYGRARLWILILTLCCLVITYGTVDFLYLYMELRFGWDYSSFVYYTIASMMVDLTGTGLIMFFASYRLGAPDCVLGLVCSVILAASRTALGLATTVSMLFLSSGLSFCGIVPLVVIRSQLSKSVSPEEVGKVFSLVSSVESILPMISLPGFTELFKLTLDYMPGAIFFAAAASFALGACLYGVMLILERLSASSSEALDDTSQEPRENVAT